ncbi:hypothetical protein CSKR_109551 [Clonorchis sinensis]|uniref:Uncharacterized protein n=1 Tax=Clonorchis sinensis TaxID=79923 RepID=A0A3R7DAF9_CLOSI|nr:hypothetical protein CSKR_109551 [Clonorchis sinensis]
MPTLLDPTKPYLNIPEIKKTQMAERKFHIHSFFSENKFTHTIKTKSSIHPKTNSSESSRSVMSWTQKYMRFLCGDWLFTGQLISYVQCRTDGGKNHSNFTACLTHSFLRTVSIPWVRPTGFPNRLNRLEVAQWLIGRSVAPQTQPWYLHCSCLGSGNLSVTKPSCFPGVAGRLGTERVLQLNSY